MDPEEAFERGVAVAELLSPQWPVDPFTVFVNDPGEILIGERSMPPRSGCGLRPAVRASRGRLILRMLIGVVAFIGIELWIGFQ